MGWGGELVKAFEDFAKFTWQSVMSNTLGNQKPSEALAKIFTGEFDANDRDAALAHTFSNHVKVLAALQRTVRAEMRIAQLAAEPIENAKNAIAKLNTEAFNTIHGLAESKNNILTNLEVVEEKIKASATDVEKTAWQKFKQLNLNRLEQVNNEIADIAKQHSLAIDKIDSPKTILDKIAGNHTYGEKYFAAISTLFNYANFARLVLNYDNVMKNGNEEDLFNYTAGWVNYVSTLSPTKAAGWFASVDKWLDVVIDEKLLANIANASRKAILSGAARGLVTGVLMDLSYKAGYEFGKILWGDVFQRIYGVTAYEYYADEFDALYSTIFQHSSGSELNAVIAFNTMILSRFVNQQRESVIKEDSADLFGADDYKEISFAKVLFTYKKLYRAVTGKNDAEQLTDAAAMMAHMESAYPAFKEFSGTKLLVLTKEQNEELLKQANRPDEYGMAARYALQNLNPFMLLGEKVDYRKFSPHGELDLYSADNPNGMTEGYLKDRLEMLKQQNDFFVHNVSGSKRFGSTGLVNSPETAHALRNMDDVLYEDFSANGGKRLQLDINYKNMPESVKQHISFGTNQNDDKGELTGGSKNDRLYGLAGDDTLKGLRGSDHMEGGIGFDTYHIEDEDTVFDSDMQGKILFDNGGKPIRIDRFESSGEPNPVIWHSPDRQFTAIRYGKDLIVSNKPDKSGKSDKVTVKDFFKLAKDNGKGGFTGLGIELLDKADLPQPSMQKRLTGIANRYNNFYANSGGYTEIIGGSLSDTVFATSSGIWAEMGDGNDRVYGSMSADMIDGGDGNDILNGSSFVPAGTNKPQAELDKDADIIIGGNGHDLIIGMAGDDTIYTGKKDEHKETKPTGMRGDWALGHLGDDTIYGSRGQDFLQGGEGSDIIHGGADDDVILGDSFIRFGSRTVLEKGVMPDAIVVPKYEYGYSTIGVENLPGKAIGFTHNAQTDQRIAEYAVSILSPQSFEWSLSINKEKGDYVLDTPKGIPLSNDQHLVEKNGAADYLYGGTGNDLIIGQTGDDFLFGEKGDDILWGDDNRDLSVAGNDYLDGGEGNDTLYGGLGNDTLAGGIGRNTLDGGEGFDTYVITGEEFAQTAATPAEKKTHNIIRDSDGQGKILVQDMDLGSLHWQLNKGTGKWSARGQEIALAQNGNDLLLQNKDGITVATVSNFQNGHLGITLPGFSAQTDKPKSEPAPTPQPVQPEPAQPEPVQPQPVQPQPVQPQPVQPQPVQPQPVQPQPVQPAPATQAVIEGGRGNETLHAAVSGSLIKARGGNDWVHGNAGNDTLIGGAGNDVLYGQAGHDELYGEDGDDRLYGGEGDDKLAGGSGNDYLAGGAGSDRYVIERNFGKDFIMNLDISPNSTDTLRITDGYTPDDFTFKRDGDNLVITEKADSRNEITVYKHFSADYRGAYAVDRIVFDNQTVLDTQAVNALVRQDAALANAANHMVQAMAGFGAGSGATAGNLIQNAAHQPLLLAASSV